MMKKLVALMMILAVTAMASATFSVDGSDLGDVSFSSDVAIAPAGGLEMYWALAVDAGTITGGASAQTGVGFDMAVWGDGSAYAGTPAIWGTLFTTGGAISDGVLFDSFVVSGASVVSLYKIKADFSGLDGPALATYSIPEPITVALLGLGGLFIRRKKA